MNQIHPNQSYQVWACSALIGSNYDFGLKYYPFLYVGFTVLIILYIPLNFINWCRIRNVIKSSMELIYLILSGIYGCNLFFNFGVFFVIDIKFKLFYTFFPHLSSELQQLQDSNIFSWGGWVSGANPCKLRTRIPIFCLLFSPCQSCRWNRILCYNRMWCRGCILFWKLLPAHEKQIGVRHRIMC